MDGRWCDVSWSLFGSAFAWGRPSAVKKFQDRAHSVAVATEWSQVPGGCPMAVERSDRRNGNVIDRHRRAAVEFVAWSDHHGKEEMLHQASLAQIEDHPDLDDGASALAQQRAWSRRHARERRLHDSALMQLRHNA